MISIAYVKFFVVIIYISLEIENYILIIVFMTLDSGNNSDNAWGLLLGETALMIEYI